MQEAFILPVFYKCKKLFIPSLFYKCKKLFMQKNLIILFSAIRTNAFLF